jgi:hypothetical protein
MPEITSRQAARLASTAAGGKMRNADAALVACTSITGPATVTWANGDTCGNRFRIPAGSRLLHAQVSCQDMGTSITLDVGVRRWTPDGTGVAIDADGIVAALDVASAAVSADARNGALVTGGTDAGILTADAEPYFTLNGGTPSANTQIRVDVFYTAS